MAKKEKKDIDSQEKLISEVQAHYDEAQAELDVRISHKTQGFDTYDKLFRSYIDPAKWPYHAKIFDPRTFGAIIKKTTRIIASKLKGRLVPRGVGQELGARIGTELLSFQWDEIDNRTDFPMLARLAQLDMNARKYGAAFALVTWRLEKNLKGETVFDGPWLEPLNNRDVLLQPGRTSIADSDYVIVRRYVSWEELKSINDTAITGPIYDEVALAQLKELKGSRGEHYTSINRYLKGLDTKPSGENRIEVCTEYRKDKWITWCPISGDKGGKTALILREIDNPYEHGQIPVVRLVYYPIDDDIYGISELEPIVSFQKALNALVSQVYDAINVDLYPILAINPQNVIMTSIEFAPRAKWLMNNPQTDVRRIESSVQSISKFREMATYIVSSMAEALGETSQEVSNLALFQSDKTATEIKDLALLRGARDNFNRLMLGCFLGKVMQLWWSMDRQFVPPVKFIRLVGKDALKYFIEQGLHEWTISDEGYELIDTYMKENPEVTFEEAYETLRRSGELEKYAVPLFPVKTKEGVVPKLQLEENGRVGFLAFEKDRDAAGDYDFIPDVESMSLPNDKDILQTRLMFFGLLKDNAQMLAQEGVKPKFKELLVKIGQSARIDDAEQYFEELPATPKEEVPIPRPKALGMPGGMPEGMNIPQEAEMPPEAATAPQAMPQMPGGGQTV